MAKKRKWGRVLAFGAITAALGGIAAYKHRKEIGRTLREIASSERTELASRFACEHGCILVLKGHRTRIALPDGRMLVNTSGCSALSKGGSGDVLTGLIASLLCQGVGAAEAAALGVWLHGRAGELLAQEMTAYCASPRELVTRGLGLAFRELLEA